LRDDSHSVEYGSSIARSAELRHAVRAGHETELADQFVGMYVNKWTLGYGDRGKRAVTELINRGLRRACCLVGHREFLGED